MGQAVLSGSVEVSKLDILDIESNIVVRVKAKILKTNLINLSN
jgi:hypothetical protein